MIVAGIDVGKANLDVSVAEGPVIRFDDTVEGISKSLEHLAEQDATVAVCESTGGYERLVVDHLRKNGCPASSILAGVASTRFAGSPPVPDPFAGQRQCGSWGRRTPG